MLDFTHTFAKHELDYIKDIPKMALRNKGN